MYTTSKYTEQSASTEQLELKLCKYEGFLSQTLEITSSRECT